MKPEKPRILVVDDEVFNLQFLTDLLIADHHISTAKDGLKALQLAASLLPDLVILDVVMPGMEEMDGMVDKFLGDGLMAIFGAPLRHETHAWQALSAAASMQKAHKGWMEERQAAGKPSGAIGIGVATGEVVVGNIGTPNRVEYTALGHPVNLAARLCGNAEGGEILTVLISQEQMQRHASALQVQDEFLTATFTSKGLMTFKNIAVPLEVFAVNAVE